MISEKKIENKKIEKPTCCLRSVFKTDAARAISAKIVYYKSTHRAETFLKQFLTSHPDFISLSDPTIMFSSILVEVKVKPRKNA